jgi:chaperonin GroEL
MNNKTAVITDKNKLFRGIDIISSTVASTMGAKGRTVLINSLFGPPLVTKDGVTVANSINLEDPIENMGAFMIKEVANKTLDKAGDGTSQVSVLSAELARQIQSLDQTNFNFVRVNNGMWKAVEDIKSILSKHTLTINLDNKEEAKTIISNIATISANNDSEIGQLIAGLVDDLGKDCLIITQPSNTLNSYTKIVEGMELDNGYISPALINDLESYTVKLSKSKGHVSVLLVDGVIPSPKSLHALMEFSKKNDNPILIIATDYEPNVIDFLCSNVKGVGLKVAAIKTPGFGDRQVEILKDLSVLTGGNIFKADPELLAEIKDVSQLGKCTDVICTKGTTKLVGATPDKKELDLRVAQIKAQLDSTTEVYDQEKLSERYFKLKSGVATLFVGGQTEMEVKEKKDRIDDALHAVKAALADGYVPGGGIMLYKAGLILANSEENYEADFQVGYNIVLKSIYSPFKTILDNAGINYSAIQESVSDPLEMLGINVLTGQKEDLAKTGIIDPVKVIITALENSVSLATTLMSSKYIISPTSQPEAYNAHQQFKF